MSDATSEPQTADTGGAHPPAPEINAPQQSDRRDARSALPVPAPRRFESRHEIKVRGEAVAFTAVAADTLIYSDDDEPIGSIFSYAYLRDGVESERRPVLFVTNGGPGAGSAGLQVGVIGPWVTPADRLSPRGDAAPTGPYPYVENEDCLLDVADLVFIDPVGTGYSRPVGFGRGEDFWGFDEDSDSIAAFIHQWLDANDRHDSPKFFLGTSYGGTRATLVADALFGGPSYQGMLRGVALNGVIALANGLGMPIAFDGIGDLALAATTLPSFAATAWYHERVDRAGRSVEEYVDEVHGFATSDYLDALHADSDGRLDDEARSAVIARAAAFIGVPPETFGGALVLPAPVYASAALGEGGRATALYDGRFTIGHFGVDLAADDAALSRTMPVLSSTWATVRRRKLGVDLPQPYAGIAWRTVLAGWNWNRRPQVLGEVDCAGTSAMHIAAMMNRNESLHLFVGGGRFDMMAPIASARYATAHAAIPADRFTLKEYDSGHEMLDANSRPALLNDLREFVCNAC